MLLRAERAVGRQASTTTKLNHPSSFFLYVPTYLIVHSFLLSSHLLNDRYSRNNHHDWRNIPPSFL